MPVEPSPLRYLQSLSNALAAQEGRVRDLIGAKHWGHDGALKEELVQDLISTHLPSSHKAAKGFILDLVSGSASKEQDILIYTSKREGPIYAQGGVVMVSGEEAAAAISIKTTLSKVTLVDSAAGLSTAREVAANAGNVALWTAAVFFQCPPAFEADPERFYRWAEDAVQAVLRRNGVPTSRSSLLPALVCVAREFLFVIDSEGENIRVRGFRCPSVAPGALVASLLANLNRATGGARTSFEILAEQVGFTSLQPAQHSFGVAPRPGRPRSRAARPDSTPPHSL